MNKKIKQPPKLNKGFSLVEMMLSLAILGTVMSISYGVIASVQHQQFRNSSLDLMNAQENIAIKYLNSNYDPIYKKIIATNSQNNYLPIVVKLDDMANYLNTAPLNFNSNSFYPTCLIINADSSKHQLNVFMLYPKKNFNDSVFTKGEVKKLSGEKNYSKVVDSTSPLVSANMNLIRSGCDIPDVYPNSMLVNLNKNMDFSSKKAMTTDLTQTTGSTSETLKSNDNNLLNKTMSTNLYFDAIVKESANYTNYYCDGNKASVEFASDLHQKCVDYAKANNTFLDGAEKITSGTVIGEKCEYTATANFSGFFTTAWIGGNTIPELVAYGQPYINAGCKYGSTQGITPSPTQICVIPFAGAEILYPNRACRYGNTYSCQTGGAQKDFTICAEDPNNQKYINEGCVKTAGPWENSTNHTGACTAQEIAYSAFYFYNDSVLCKVGGSTSTPTQCGKLSKDAYQDRGVTPPSHKYQGISLGDKGKGNILIKSATPDGTTINQDVALNISNAGVKSGYVLIKSQPILADTSCTASQIGKIVQQQNDNTLYTASQLVCTYDPDFCGGTGYCLSPLKSQSLMVINPSAQSQAICPAGLRLDTSINLTVTNGMLSSSPTCSTTYNNETLTSPTNGTLDFISDTGSGSKRIYGYSSTCKYSGGSSYPLSNILKMRCISAAQTKSFNNCKGNANGIVTCS